ncbi:MAG: sugar ABC transporter permease [Methanomassiliicoccales archaeon]|nr:sugar ABC transporter permease [Methanomassiliicoccales archaeon]
MTKIIGLLLVTPLLLLTGFFLFYPLINSILTSFFDTTNLAFFNNFVGLKHYYHLTFNPTFKLVLQNTFILVTGTVGGSFIIAFFIALLLTRQFPGRAIVRGLVVIPWVVPNVVAALSWRWVFDERYGIINAILTNLKLSAPINWLGEPFWAFVALIIVSIWKATPVMTVFLLAGLQAIPKELYEAATIDGAGAFQMFRYVTLPQMRRIILIVLTMETIWNFNAFDIIWILTRGGPANSTHTLATFVYQQAFQLFNTGLAAATGVLMLVILLAITGLYLRLLKEEKL